MKGKEKKKKKGLNSKQSMLTTHLKPQSFRISQAQNLTNKKGPHSSNRRTHWDLTKWGQNTHKHTKPKEVETTTILCAWTIINQVLKKMNLKWTKQTIDGPENGFFTRTKVSKNKRKNKNPPKIPKYKTQSCAND